jgi:hypothetical protein
VPGHVQHHILGRGEITQAALGVRSAVGGLKVQFPDINVTVAPDKQSAEADLTVEVNISSERERIVQEMKFTLQKTDGKWLITRIETVRTLSFLNFEAAPAPFITDGIQQKMAGFRQSACGCVSL